MWQRVKTKSQKVFRGNSYVCRSYRVKTGRGTFCCPPPPSTPPLTHLNPFWIGLKALKDGEYVDKLYFYLKPANSPNSRFEVQPKLQKPGVSIRHIISYSGSILYNLNKYIADILKAYVEDKNKSAENSTTFSNYIRNVLIEDDETMVLFGVQFYNWFC